MNLETKKTWNKPELVTYGSIEQITGDGVVINKVIGMEDAIWHCIPNTHVGS